MPATANVRIAIPMLAASLLWVPTARADEPSAHRLGDHPAVVVQRLLKKAGYDYASKFYPHPAGLWLYMTEPPRDPIDAAAPQREPDRSPDAAAAQADQREATGAVLGGQANGSAVPGINPA